MAIKIITNTDPTKGETVMNCNPNLTHYCIPVHSPEWYDFRYGGIEGVYDGGIGASECYKVLQVEKEDYAPVLPQLMEWKAGFPRPEQKMTEAMLWGILHEPTILNAWKRIDGTDEGYVLNYVLNEIKRKCEPVNAYIVNKRFPWLFVSLDSKILKGQSTLHGKVLDKDSPLESKTMNQMVYDIMIKSGVRLPNRYVYQTQTQMLVTETEYSEVPMLVGGAKFKCEYVLYDAEIGEAIAEKTRECWITVLKMRKMRLEREDYAKAGDWAKIDEIDSEIQSILPLPGAGEAYDEYYESKYLESGVQIKGSFEHFDLIRRRGKVGAVMKMLEEYKDSIENIFAQQFIQYKADFIDFDELGKVKYVKQSNWKTHKPDFKGIKEKIAPKEVQAIFNSVIEQLS